MTDPQKSMKNSIPILLSVCALAMSTLAVLSSRPAPVEKTAAERSSSAEVPLKDPDLDGKCGIDAVPVKDLDDLMNGQMNAALTRISFALHHDRGDIGERTEKAAACAAQLVDSSYAAANFRPKTQFDQLPEYYALLNQLQGHAFALKTASLEGNVDEARHWYAHVKQSCIQCHSRFRVD